MFQIFLMAFAKIAIFLVDKAYRRDDIKDDFILEVERFTGLDLAESYYTDAKLVKMLLARKRIREQEAAKKEAKK